MTRRLAAIMITDVVGYSRLSHVDEEGMRRRFQSDLHELFAPAIARYRGRLVKTMGDGLLIEFGSVVEAVRCAVDVQRAKAESNVEVPADRRLVHRIGINLGDVIIEGGDIYGDGVNIAARLEGLAEPGGIFVSRAVRDSVRDKLGLVLEDLGEKPVKNIARPVHVYAIGEVTGAPTAARPAASNPSRRWRARSSSPQNAAATYAVCRAAASAAARRRRSRASA